MTETYSFISFVFKFGTWFAAVLATKKPYLDNQLNNNFEIN